MLFEKRSLNHTQKLSIQVRLRSPTGQIAQAAEAAGPAGSKLSATATMHA